MKLQGERQEEQQKELTAKVGSMEERFNAPQASSSVHLPAALQPSSFTVPIEQGLDLNAPATVGQCMEMVRWR